MSTKGKQNYWLRRAQPITKIEEDKLFSDFYKYFKNILLAIEPPFVIGISGEWGRGKTSLFNVLKNDDKIKTKFYPIIFEAWKYQKTGNLPGALVKFIAKSLEISNESEYIENLIKSLSNLFEVSIRFGIFSIKPSFKQKFQSIEEIEKEFQGVIEEWKAKNSTNREKKLLVFIDDLDRCLPEFSLEFLESIKHFFSIPEVVFVVAMDPELLEIVLQKLYGKDSPINALDYLEKFVDLFLQLPKYEPKRVSDFLDYLFSEKYKVSENINTFEIVDFFKQNNQLNHSLLLTNPRKLDRVVKNFIIVTTMVSRENKSVIHFSYTITFLMLMLREYFSELFEQIKIDGKLPFLIYKVADPGRSLPFKDKKLTPIILDDIKTFAERFENIPYLNNESISIIKFIGRIVNTKKLYFSNVGYTFDEIIYKRFFSDLAKEIEQYSFRKTPKKKSKENNK